MLINHAAKQVTAKIVYYGPGLSGKTSNLQYIYSVTSPKSRGELISMETEVERTLFFDLLPMNVGLVKGYLTKIQLYTVPGQVFYDSTRKLVLKGADGVVFVADSQALMQQANLESLNNLQDNLEFYKNKIEEIPLVFQYNKRDLKNILSVEELNASLNRFKRPYFEAIALKGEGVLETLKEISQLTLLKIKEELEKFDIEKRRTIVQFDFQKKKEIISKEEFPLKKITIETPDEEVEQKIISGEIEQKPKTIKREEKFVSLDDLKKQLLTPTISPKPKQPMAKMVEANAGQEVVALKESITYKRDFLFIELKDEKGDMLRSFNVRIGGKTKKINLEIDVKD